MPEYGVVYRTEGYTSSGKLKDIEHNFYTKNDEGVIYQASSHYRNVQYSEAYDIYFTEHSDIFYSEFQNASHLLLFDVTIKLSLGSIIVIFKAHPSISTNASAPGHMVGF